MNQTITVTAARTQHTNSNTNPTGTKSATTSGAQPGTDAIESAGSRRRTDRPARTIWMPWTQGTKPNTAIEEASFVIRLGDLAREQTKAHTRSDVTAVLNALRCGVVVDDLLERAPGLDPVRLFAAYRSLDVLRERASAAWSSITADQSCDAVIEFGEEAGKLLPSLIGRLYTVMESSPGDVGAVIRDIAGSVQITASVVRAIEHGLHMSAVGSDQRTNLGRLLYDPHGAGATSRPDYLARRVGTLVPTAVAALLGERVDITAPPSVGTVR